jgi:hypothetical protein
MGHPAVVYSYSELLLQYSSKDYTRTYRKNSSKRSGRCRKAIQNAHMIWVEPVGPLARLPEK